MGTAEKLRKAREHKVEAEGFAFNVRRPTELDMIEMGRREMNARRALSFVCGQGEQEPLLVGWENVREIDMLDGGEPHPMPFDLEAAREWFRDRPQLLIAVAKGAIDAYNRYAEQRETERKN